MPSRAPSHCTGTTLPSLSSCCMPPTATAVRWSASDPVARRARRATQARVAVPRPLEEPVTWGLLVLIAVALIVVMVAALNRRGGAPVSPPSSDGQPIERGEDNGIDPVVGRHQVVEGAQ